MLKKIAIIILTLFFVFTPVASAQGNNFSTSPATTQRTELKEKIKEQRDLAKEKFKTRREEFKEKLNEISDQKKQAIITRVDARLASVNEKTTDKLTQALIRLDEVLAKLSDQTATAKANGKDTTKTDAAIIDAEKTIEVAKTAVQAQAGKEYIATITDETGLGEAISSVTKQLRADLKVVFDAAREAKRSVRNVAIELRSLNKIGADQEQATQSATISPSI